MPRTGTATGRGRSGQGRAVALEDLLSEELADLLAAEDVDGFNGRRTERSRPELFAADLANKALVGVDLSNANLEKADLTEADLTDGNLTRAIVAGADATGAIFRNVMGLRAKFREAWMDQSVLEEAEFSQSDFTGAVLDGSNGTGVRLAQARLKHVQAKGVTWPDADLAEAKLFKADFSGSDLSRSDFTETSAAEAVFEGARLDGIVGPGAKLPEANLQGASLVAARLVDANLSGALLQGANLSAADLTRVNLAGADLTGADLSNAVLSEACLDGAKLEGATLRGADLSGLDVRALGLDDATIATLSGHGIPYDADAPRNLKGCSAARLGDRVGVVWLNADSVDEEGQPVHSLRWGSLQAGAFQHGVVSVPADTVVDAQVVRHAERLHLVMIRRRPDGMVLEDHELTGEGPRGARVVPLGYEPQVRPVFQARDGRLHLFGLARRGPTVVVHRFDAEEGWTVLHSDRSPTAVGFLGGVPVLQGKGGVLTPVSPRGLGDPRRAPDTFPGVAAVACPDEGDLLVVWAIPGRPPEVPGGLRFARIERRGTPEVQVVSLADHVKHLVSAPTGDGMVMAWLEGLADGIHGTTAWVCTLPSGVPTPVAPDVDDAIRVRVAGDLVTVVRADGTAWFGDLTGRALGAST